MSNIVFGGRKQKKAN